MVSKEIVLGRGIHIQHALDLKSHHVLRAGSRFHRHHLNAAQARFEECQGLFDHPRQPGPVARRIPAQRVTSGSPKL